MAPQRKEAQKYYLSIFSLRRIVFLILATTHIVNCFSLKQAHLIIVA